MFDYHLSVSNLEVNSHMIIRIGLVDDVTICKIYNEIFGKSDVDFILVYDK